ncbi:hypothetical protein H6P81_019231 [Aristolochia fimbriata]|uniref:Uncharacterized protein n=1 Tax=Aristolochia fimbriata TaxID=158543 RepID=A0AAV7DTT7_ARIFI|nr:hypothetical protein H6P81_019231 [Aristolochia fimbriata]
MAGKREEVEEESRVRARGASRNANAAAAAAASAAAVTEPLLQTRKSEKKGVKIVIQAKRSRRHVREGKVTGSWRAVRRRRLRCQGRSRSSTRWRYLGWGRRIGYAPRSGTGAR